jgi:hypothetical protein
MTARFIPADYPGGRILLRSGSVDVGAVFPPLGDPGTARQNFAWVWRLWRAHTTGAIEGRAKTELAARSALLSAWRETLHRMALTEALDHPAPETPIEEAQP